MMDNGGSMMKPLLGTMMKISMCLLLSSYATTSASSEMIYGVNRVSMATGLDENFSMHDTMNEPHLFNEGNNVPLTHEMISLTFATTKNKTNCVTDEKTLRRAISKAPTNSSKPTDISLCKKNIAINGSKFNPITNRNGISIVDKNIRFNCALPRSQKCSLDAQGESRHFYVFDSALSFNQIKFINGKSKNDNLYNETYSADGGSFFISSSTIKMKNCDFDSNDAPSDYNGWGGALFVTMSSFQIEKTKLMSNSGVRGAAMFFSYSVVNIDDTIFESNNASNTGGAIDARFNENLIVTGSVFNRNSAQAGGAINILNNINVSITGNSFSRNYAASDAGAIYSFNNKFDITDNVFTENTALQSAGGAVFSSNSNVSVVKNVFTSNQAFYGGAVACQDSKISIAENVFRSNKVVGVVSAGGAIWSLFNIINITANDVNNNSAEGNRSVAGAIFSYDTDIDITFNYIEDNSAESGAAVVTYFDRDDIIVTNNAFWNNSAIMDPKCNVFVYANFDNTTNATCLCITV